MFNVSQTNKMYFYHSGTAELRQAWITSKQHTQPKKSSSSAMPALYVPRSRQQEDHRAARYNLRERPQSTPNPNRCTEEWRQQFRAQIQRYWLHKGFSYACIIVWGLNTVQTFNFCTSRPDIWRRVVGNVLIMICPSNILPIVLKPEIFLQNCQAGFGRCEY